jgi:beta-lactamase regulating signal transducer with metallopeptidase domain
VTFLVDGSLITVPAADWVGYLSDLVLKSAFLLALSHVSARALSRWPAAVRSRTWTTAFALLAALPVLAAFQPAGAWRAWHDGAVVRVLQMDLDSRRYRQPAVVAERGTKSPPEPAAVATSVKGSGGARSDRIARPAYASGATAFRLQHWQLLVAFWLAGFLGVAARSIIRFRSGLAAANRALPASDGTLSDIVCEMRQRLGIRRPIEPRICASTPVPFVTGLRRVRLVLPACASEWTTSELRAVILHELAHVKRRDLSRLLLAELVTALYWFNPLAWIAARRSALAVEMACDDVVCRAERKELDYARQLLRLAQAAARPGQAAHVPGLARKLDLEARMSNILEPATDWVFARRSELGWAPLRRVVALGWPVFIILFSLPVAVLKTVSREDPFPQVVETTGVVTPMQSAGFNRGALVDSPRRATFDSGTTIYEAAHDGDLDGVVGALALDPDLLNATDDEGMTPLALAAWNGHLELAHDLLNRGADPDIRNHNGLTPLFCAVDRARRELSMLLIRSGADLNTRGYRGRTLLHMTARSGDLAVARSLLRRGADVNATDVRGVTPLDLAVWHGHPGLERLLVDNGAVHSGLQPPPQPHKKRTKDARRLKSTT